LKELIASFSDSETRKLFETGRSRRIPAALQRTALRKLNSLHFALTLEDLMIPPCNRLEALRGDRRGQYSIRINAQYRICFLWTEGNAYEVEIVDYH